MLPRAPRFAKVGLLLVSAFLVGGGSAEVAVRAHGAIERAKAERETGAAGQLVALQLTDAFGEVVARPRVIAPAGKATELVLREPGAPDTVRLTFRIEAVRESSGDIAIDYTLWVPGHDVSARGRLSLTPGVEETVELEGGVLVATWIAVPVPSTSFDAFLEGEAAAARRAPGSST